MHWFSIKFKLHQQRAKEQGAVFIRDIWEEHDDHGTVRFATVKTVIY